ncbi:MAG: SDR family oxidoreductase [Ahrensia sp.]
MANVTNESDPTVTRSTLILGAGFSGKAYGALLAAHGQTVYGTTRSKDKAAALEAVGIKALIFDGSGSNDALAQALSTVSDLVVSIAPDEAGDPVLNALADSLADARHLQWVAYLSTVGVYGNHDGAWVDETTVPKPVSKRSIWRVNAEAAWQDWAHRRALPLAILRLSGIFGPGRNGLVTLSEGRARRLLKKDQVFNRIHVHDIARALDFLSGRRAGGIYNVTDDLPAPPQDVVAYAASLMKIDPPDEIDFETATLSPMARSFYGENKRVSNAKIKEAGFDFHYPNYKDTFARMWAENTWQKPD